jgi:hypothetical protein
LLEKNKPEGKLPYMFDDVSIIQMLLSEKQFGRKERKEEGKTKKY